MTWWVLPNSRQSCDSRVCGSEFLLLPILCTFWYDVKYGMGDWRGTGILKVWLEALSMSKNSVHFQNGNNRCWPESQTAFWHFDDDAASTCDRPYWVIFPACLVNMGKGVSNHVFCSSTKHGGKLMYLNCRASPSIEALHVIVQVCKAPTDNFSSRTIILSYAMGDANKDRDRASFYFLWVLLLMMHS